MLIDPQVSILMFSFSQKKKKKPQYNNNQIWNTKLKHKYFDDDNQMSYIIWLS